jgi:enoyl-CoA hydratase/carnithine racemase
MSDDILLRERRGRVEILTLNRPKARNAISPELANAIGGALDELAADDDVWVVVITGNGPVFCAGADLKVVAEGRGAEIDQAPGGFGGIARREFPKPLIAAVNGPALAGGFEIVLSCDLVVAADDATFGLPEAKRGLIAAAGGLIRLAHRIPVPIAHEIAMTGEPIDVARAHGLGLVNRVVPVDRVLDEALALAEMITANAPLSVRLSKKVVCDAEDQTEEEGWRITFAAAAELMQSEDVIEGSMAFVEKRAPVWKGR